LVDGATGKILHAGKPYPQQSEAYCLDERWYVVAQPNFQLDFYDARSPQAPVSVTARDKLREYGKGDGCAAFNTADGTTSGVELPAGTVTRCKAERMRAIHEGPPGLLGLTTHSGAVSVGRRVYTLTKRAQGTEILTLTVTQGKRQLWSKELPYASATFSSGIAVADNRIVLWAAEPANRRVGVLVGLDEKTGKQLYAKPQGKLTSNSIQYLGYNGRYVVVAWSSGLFAYDPTTGDIAWQLGRGI
jgi:outer membrane protein assembly factor BamB